ncbi:MAG TPA: ABC transporter transmembrane domain-containing protein, partial [Anaerolineales bacterium]|nr:ABC transporter transmembrane domain-containing protein [Anaerolineales bacterium]
MGFHGGGKFMVLSDLDEKPKVTMGLLRRVMGYSKPYRWQLVSMLLLILCSTGLALLAPLILRNLIDAVIPSGDISRLVMLAVALLLIPAVGGGLGVFQRRLNAAIGEGVIYDLRVALYARLQRMSLHFFTNTKLGELMSRLNNDVVGAQNAISNTIVNIITNIVQAAAVMAVMLTLEWRLTLISIIILPLFILAARHMGGRLRDVSRQQLEANAHMNATMNETLNIGGALLVKLFGRATTEVKRFEGRAAAVRDLGIRRALLGAIFFIIIGLVGAVGSALIYGIGGYLVIQKTFTIGTIVAFGTYMSSLYGALQGLTNAPVDFATSVVSFERVFEVIDLPHDIVEKSDARVLKDVQGELVFEHVTFKYDLAGKALLSDVKRYGRMDNITTALSGGVDEPKIKLAPQGNGHLLPDEEETIHTQARLKALDEVSFSAKPGQLVALVGPSGAGKTTLTYLIPRLYDPTDGRILLDNIDLREVTLDSLSAIIGMVTQETHMFHDTIRTNLLYARLDATQEELEAACRAANIHDFIVNLPDGYDT